MARYLAVGSSWRGQPGAGGTGNLQVNLTLSFSPNPYLPFGSLLPFYHTTDLLGGTPAQLPPVGTPPPAFPITCLHTFPTTQFLPATLPPVPGLQGPGTCHGPSPVWVHTDCFAYIHPTTTREACHTHLQLQPATGLYTAAYIYHLPTVCSLPPGSGTYTRSNTYHYCTFFCHLPVYDATPPPVPIAWVGDRTYPWRSPTQALPCLVLDYGWNHACAIFRCRCHLCHHPPTARGGCPTNIPSSDYLTMPAGDCLRTWQADAAPDHVTAHIATGILFYLSPMMVYATQCPHTLYHQLYPQCHTTWELALGGHSGGPVGWTCVQGFVPDLEDSLLGRAMAAFTSHWDPILGGPVGRGRGIPRDQATSPTALLPTPASQTLAWLQNIRR